MISLAVAILAAQGTAVSPPQVDPSAFQVAPTTPSAAARLPEIVVTGKRLSAAREALADCVASKCPPNEEIAATIAYAEELLLMGDYQRARETLLKGRARNNRYASQFPMEVSGLNRANARLANLNGEVDAARIGAIDTLDILKKAFGTDDSRVLVQRLEVADAFMAQGRLDAATDVYDQVARQAKRSGNRLMEGAAMLRNAALFNSLSMVRPEYQPEADRAAARIMKMRDPEMEPFRLAVTAMLASRAAANKNDRTLERLRADMPRSKPSQPMLVFAPPIDFGERAEVQSGVVAPVLSQDATPRWADVGFRIDRDGNVADVAVLRASSEPPEAWLRPVVASVQGRRYAPLAIDVTDPGVWRVERFSYVHDRILPTGSHIPAARVVGRVQTLDISGP